jgi:hypothetical protein
MISSDLDADPALRPWPISGKGNPYFNTAAGVGIVIHPYGLGWAGHITHHRSGLQRSIYERSCTESDIKRITLELAQEMAAKVPPPRFVLAEIANAPAAPEGGVTFTRDELRIRGLDAYCSPGCTCDAEYRLAILECANRSLQLRLQCADCARMCSGVVAHDKVEPGWITPGIARSNAK